MSDIIPPPNISTLPNATKDGAAHTTHQLGVWDGKNVGQQHIALRPLVARETPLASLAWLLEAFVN